jgi:hypothetical protein
MSTLTSNKARAVLLGSIDGVLPAFIYKGAGDDASMVLEWNKSSDPSRRLALLEVPDGTREGPPRKLRQDGTGGPLRPTTEDLCGLKHIIVDIEGRPHSASYYRTPSAGDTAKRAGVASGPFAFLIGTIRLPQGFGG